MILPLLKNLRWFLFLLPVVLRAALADYNVMWDSPSRNSSESMPCGGGDIGLNVWVENGDLLIYLSRSGTFDELNGMPKLGRLRVTLSPNPFAAGGKFRQELKLREGFVQLQGEKDGVAVTLDVWVDVFRPVVHLSAATSQPTTLTAAYESWRLTPRAQPEAEMGPNRSFMGAPVPALVRPDVVSFEGDTVQFVHRNNGPTDFDVVVEQQGLTSVRDRLWNPLVNLTFGGALSGTNLVAAGERDGRYASTDYRAWQLRSRAPARQHDLQAVLHVATTPTLEAWESGLATITADASHAPDARASTEKWWAAFWNRSHVFINAAKSDPASPVWQVGRNYQVFRYQLGCNARGAYPTKFNGGLFTFDPEYVDPEQHGTPDFRRWGGGSFTAQNQRLVYWPMLKSGDVDAMKPQFDFYRRALGNAETRSEVYWGIRGASFTEQIENFGLPVAYEYGWKRSPDVPAGIEDSAWVNYQWDTVLEFCQMILESHRYTGADIAEYLPLVESCLRFYEEFYQRAEKQRNGSPWGYDGKLVLYPATALETYKDALNPASTLSALRVVLTTLTALPDSLLPADRRAHWRELLGRLPGYAFRRQGGETTLAPAWVWSRVQNVEFPQLYPVYPWGLYGIGKPDLPVAIATWRYGIDRPDQKQIKSWHQDAIFSARLGLTEEAADLTIQKMRDAERRFPTWWGPGHDWVPDHNWGGSGMIGVQEMLLQVVDEKLYVLPAWPKDWDVDFKLHAPGNTTVEVVYQSGKIQNLRVTPESRARDVVLP